MLDLAGETGLLSPVLSPYLESRLAHRGIPARVERVHAGIVGGLEVHGFGIYDSRLPGQLLFEAGSIRCRPTWSALFGGAAFGWKTSVGNGRFFIFRPSAIPVPNPQMLQLDEVQVVATLRGRSVNLHSVTGSLAGIKLRCRGNIRNWKHEAEPATGLSWHAVYRSMTPRHRDVVERVFQFFQDHQFPEEDARIQAVLDLPLEEMDRAAVEAQFSLPNIVYRTIPLTTLKGRATLAAGKLSMSRVSAVVDRRNVLRGKGTFNVHTGRISGRLSGALEPSLLFQALERPRPGWLQPVIWADPVSLSLDLLPSPVRTPADWRLRGNLQVQKVRYRDLRVTNGQTQLAVNGTKWKLSDVQLALASNTSGTIGTLRGEMALDADLEHFSGRVTAHCRSLSCLRALQLIPDKLHALTTTPGNGLDTISLQLTASSPRLENTRVEGHAEFRTLQWMDLPINVAKGRVQLKDSRLTLSEAVITPDDDAEDVSLRGNITVDLEQERVSSNIAGTLGAEHIKRASPESGFRRVLSHFADTTAQVSFNLHPSPYLPLEWRGEGTIEADHGTFEDVAFTGLAANVALKHQALTIRIEHATTSKGTIEDATVAIDLPEVNLHIAGRAVADPRLFRIFVPRGDARHNYDRVWRGFEWGEKTSLPELELTALDFFPNTGRMERWKLNLRGQITDDAVTYRGVTATRAQATVNLELQGPGGVIRVTGIEAEQGQQRVSGDMTFSFNGSPTCTVDIDGEADPWLILAAIDPHWTRFRTMYAFSSRTRFKAHVRVPLRKNGAVEVNGEMLAPTLRLRDITFANAKGHWHWENKTLVIDSLNADAHRGTVEAKAHYNFARRTGALTTEAEKLGLKSLTSDLEGGRAFQGEGRLSGAARVQFRTDDDDRLLLHGDGDLTLDQADLWEMPFFSQLADLLKLNIFQRMAGLGKISRLDADFRFKDRHVQVPEFTTDGTIISLKGKGKYLWPQRELQFTVRGILLKRTVLIPWATRLLSWIFEAELGGTPADPEWTLVSALRRALSEDKEDNP